MPLSERDIERYARQIVIPEVGGSGQERLLASIVELQGHTEALDILERYLRATGVQVTREPDRRADCLILADREPDGESLSPRGPDDRTPIVWYRIVGCKLLGGVTASKAPSSGRSECHRSQSDDGAAAGAPVSTLLHAIAACDAAARAIGVLLGWQRRPTEPADEAPLA